MQKYPWAKYWTQELLLMCSCHPVGQPLPSVRVLQWTGDSFRVYPGLRPWVELDLDKKRQHPATLTEERKRKQTNKFYKWTIYVFIFILYCVIGRISNNTIHSTHSYIVGRMLILPSPGMIILNNNAWIFKYQLLAVSIQRNPYLPSQNSVSWS